MKKFKGRGKKPDFIAEDIQSLESWRPASFLMLLFLHYQFPLCQMSLVHFLKIYASNLYKNIEQRHLLKSATLTNCQQSWKSVFIPYHVKQNTSKYTSRSQSTPWQIIRTCCMEKRFFFFFLLKLRLTHLRVPCLIIHTSWSNRSQKIITFEK